MIFGCVSVNGNAENELNFIAILNLEIHEKKDNSYKSFDLK